MYEVTLDSHIYMYRTEMVIRNNHYNTLSIHNYDGILSISWRKNFYQIWYPITHTHAVYLFGAVLGKSTNNEAVI